MRVLNFVLSLSALLALTGCGGGAKPKGAEPTGGEDANVRFLISDLQAASRDGDGERICNELFTPRLADSVTSASDTGSCPKEVEQNLFNPEERMVVDDVQVANSTNATATVRESNGKVSKVSVVKQGGEWRISGVRPG